jgi:hypothetical protein
MKKNQKNEVQRFSAHLEEMFWLYSYVVEDSTVAALPPLVQAASL